MSKTRAREITSHIMSAIPSKDTAPEKQLGVAMWNLGLRYRKHYTTIGKPDFAFVRKKVAVFCDGDFWHGNNWRLRGFSSLEEELKSYNPYWREKIRRNIERDADVNSKLSAQGWTVVRFWASEIQINSDHCAREVLKVLKSK